MSLAAYVALRIVRSRRSTTLSLVTLISIAGIAFGVMALTIVLSVTNGFEAAFEDKILGLYPHLVVTRRSSIFRDYDPLLETIRQTEGVVGATPLTGDEMMVANGVFRGGATVQGIALDSVGGVIDLEALITAGSLDGLGERPTLTPAGEGRLVLDGMVEGTFVSVVVGDDGPSAFIEERASPDPGHVRVTLLDMRAEADAPVVLRPRGGAAVEVYGLDKAEPLDSAPGRFGTAVELAAGEWELQPTGQRLALEAKTQVTIVLFGGAGDDDVTSRLLVEADRVEPRARTARVRLIDTRATGPPQTLVDASGAAVTPPVGPGEFSEYFAVKARLPGILLGSALAARLRAGVGDELTLVTPLRGIDNKMMGPFGMMPSSAHFQVAGIFEAGFHDHDLRLALVNIGVSQRFLNRGRIIRSIAVETNSLMDVEATKKRLARAIDPYDFEAMIDSTENLRERMLQFVEPGMGTRRLSADGSFIGGIKNVAEAVNLLKFNRQDYTTRTRYQIHDWKEKNINLFSALKLQKVVLTMFFLIIIIVGSFVVVGSQIMVVHEKTADIAILKAMGATRGMVRLIFTLQGLLVAAAGVAIGLLVGLGFIWLIDAVDYKLEASIYLIDHLPVDVNVLEVVLVAIGALLCTFLTTQISAARAAGKTPVAGLRAVD